MSARRVRTTQVRGDATQRLWRTTCRRRKSPSELKTLYSLETAAFCTNTSAVQVNDALIQQQADKAG